MKILLGKNDDLLTIADAFIITIREGEIKDKQSINDFITKIAEFLEARYDFCYECGKVLDKRNTVNYTGTLYCSDCRGERY